MLPKNTQTLSKYVFYLLDILNNHFSFGFILRGLLLFCPEKIINKFPGDILFLLRNYHLRTLLRGGGLLLNNLALLVVDKLVKHYLHFFIW